MLKVKNLSLFSRTNKISNDKVTELINSFDEETIKSIFKNFDMENQFDMENYDNSFKELLLDFFTDKYCECSLLKINDRLSILGEFNSGILFILDNKLYRYVNIYELFGGVEINLIEDKNILVIALSGHEQLMSLVIDLEDCSMSDSEHYTR